MGNGGSKTVGAGASRSFARLAAINACCIHLLSLPVSAPCPLVFPLVLLSLTPLTRCERSGGAAAVSPPFPSIPLLMPVLYTHRLIASTQPLSLSSHALFALNRYRPDRVTAV